MPYPDNPFPVGFSLEILKNTYKTEEQNVDSSIQILHEKTLKWLCTSPKITSYRINTLKTKIENVFSEIEKQVQRISQDKVYEIKCCKDMSEEVILVKNNTEIPKLEKQLKEVIVDVNCGAAILRGAHIFAPGVLGMVSGAELDDHVSVYIDINNKCRRGLQKIFTEEKIFIANGIVKKTRKHLFGENPSSISGVAVEITASISGCPPLGDDFIPTGFALLQNIPSIVCILNLDPSPGDVVLDMCASPGNKTTHIAALMNNKGKLIALDKTPNKLKTLQKNCHNYGAKVYCFQADSTQIVVKSTTELPGNVEYGPPFLPASFDKILLDAPCSALGKRPQFLNRSTEKVIMSHVPLQRKLFEVAVSLLKPGGTLTYSTCTITLGENEGIVAWALEKFNCLELVKPDLYLGGFGWPGTSLTEDDLKKVQRFGPEQDEYDSVGFFIACFKRRKLPL